MIHLKKILCIFLTAFALNIIWENLHSSLYVHYQGGIITEFILFRATFWDALIISLVLLPFLFLPVFQKRVWLILAGCIFISIIIEWFALASGRWEYNSLMPVIPILKTGLTPTIQLGLLGLITYKLEQYIFRKSK